MTELDRGGERKWWRQDTGFVMLRKKMQDMMNKDVYRSSLRLDNDVRFAANSTLKCDIPRENWKMMRMARFCMASSS